MIKIIYGLIFISCIFSNQQRNIIAISQINTSQLYNSELNMKISYNRNQNLSYGMQWWVSSNYFVNGNISPNISNNRNSIYQKLSLGNLVFSNDYYKSIIEFGIHKQRFNFQNESTWYELSMYNKLLYKRIIFDIIISQLYCDRWSSLLSSLSFSYIISNFYQINCMISIDTSYNIYPSLNCLKLI